MRALTRIHKPIGRFAQRRVGSLALDGVAEDPVVWEARRSIAFVNRVIVGSRSMDNVRMASIPPHRGAFLTSAVF